MSGGYASFLFVSFLCLLILKGSQLFRLIFFYGYITVLIFCDILYRDTIDEIVIGLTPCAVYALITTVNTAEKCATLPAHIMKTTLLFHTPAPTPQGISKRVV